MEELLAEMQKENPDEDVINALASDLFITRAGHINMVEKDKFEKFAPCKIYRVEGDSFGWLIGGIQYGEKKFTFG